MVVGFTVAGVAGAGFDAAVALTDGAAEAGAAAAAFASRAAVTQTSATCRSKASCRHIACRWTLAKPEPNPITVPSAKSPINSGRLICVLLFTSVGLTTGSRRRRGPNGHGDRTTPADSPTRRADVRRA